MALGSVVLAGLVSAAAASTGSVSAASSAKRCAGGHSVSAKLSGADFNLIKSFVICLGKQWPVSTSELGDVGSGQGGYKALGGIPAITNALNSLANDSKVDATNSFVSQLLNATKRDGSCMAFTWGDTSPPPITLLSIAGWIDTAHARVDRDWSKYQGGFLRTTVVVERGAWFHDGSSKNVRFAVVFAESDPLGGPHSC